jgi:hypothetical protein
MDFPEALGSDTAIGALLWTRHKNGNGDEAQYIRRRER